MVVFPGSGHRCAAPMTESLEQTLPHVITIYPRPGPHAQMSTSGQGWGKLGKPCLSDNKGSQLQGASWPRLLGSPLRSQMMPNQTGAQMKEGARRVAGAGVARGFMSAQHFLTAFVNGDALLLAQLFSSCVLFSLKIM